MRQDGKSGTNKPPVIWQLKALARGAGCKGNQGAQRPPLQQREDHVTVSLLVRKPSDPWFVLYS